VKAGGVSIRLRNKPPLFRADNGQLQTLPISCTPCCGPTRSAPRAGWRPRRR
jgi:hypothetical protein